MSVGHAHRAKYDYVELTVEERDGCWLLKLKGNRHGDTVLHDEEFATAVEAQDAALALAQRHINVAHNDTLLCRTTFTWHSRQP